MALPNVGRSSEMLSDQELDCLIGQKFEIKISPSFGSKYAYKYGSSKGEACLIKLSFKNSEVISYEWVVLPNEEGVKVINEYRSVYTFELFDKYSYSIADGESWEITNNLDQHFYIKIASPSLYPEKRGYEKLLKFKNHLECYLKSEKFITKQSSRSLPRR